MRKFRDFIQNREKNTHLESRRRTKKVFLMIGLGILIVIFLSSGKFLLFNDQVTEEIIKPVLLKTDGTDKEIILKEPKYANADLEAVFDDKIEPDILRFNLKSHGSVNEIKKVGLGKQVVMYYDVNSVYQLENALGEPEFIDVRSGEQVEREWRYVYLANESYEVPVSECSMKKNINGTLNEVCEQIGTETRTYETWLPYDSKNIPKGNIRIGIEVEVKNKDHVDGIWNVGGRRIDKHAQWTSDLADGLVTWIPFNDTSGTTATDVFGNSTYNGELIGDAEFTASGKVGQGVWVNASTKFVNFTYSLDSSEGTFIVWYNATAVSGSWGKDEAGIVNGDWIFLPGTGDELDFRIDDGGVRKTLNADTEIQTGIPTMLVIRWNSTGGFDYFINGTEQSDHLTGITARMEAGSGNCWALGAGMDGSCNIQGSMQGVWDELAYYNVSLSDAQITQLYNDGNGCTYGLCDATEPTTLNVILTSPKDNATFTTNNINFISNVTSTNSSVLTIQNVSLLINGVINQTNISGIEGEYNFSLTTADGSYNWTMIAFGNDSVKYSADNGTLDFTIDGTSPVLDVTFPNETIEFHKKNDNLFVNWTVTDANIDVCLVEYENSNTTVTCNDNQTTINITNGTAKTLTFYANDTAGNQVSETVTWNYRLFLNSQTFDSELFEGIQTTFSANFLINGSIITQANLSYDSTENLGSINNHGGNNFTVTKTITSPSVTSNENKTFFWNITQGGFFFALDEENQTINNFQIDDCSTNTNILYNFTIVDEEDQEILGSSTQNTSAKLFLQVFGYSTTTLVEGFNKSYSKINPFAVCLTDFTTGHFSHDLQVQYSADEYATELYHIQNETINTSTINKNITLFDLNESNAQIFKIIFRDSSFLPVENALINISRKYIDEGVFKTVEIPKSDGRGESLGHFVLDKVIYNIQVVKFGEVLATFNNVIAVCQNPTLFNCEMDLNAFSDTLELPDFEEGQDFNFTITYNNNTRVVSSVFSIPSGTTSVVSLNVTRIDALGTAICTDSLTTSSGTLSCTVPDSFGNSTISAKLYKNGVISAQGGIKLNQNPIDIYGVALVVLGIFVMMTLVGVSITNSPIITTLFLMLGVILLFSLNLAANNGFIGATATILWMVIAVIILITKGARRN